MHESIDITTQPVTIMAALIRLQEQETAQKAGEMPSPNELGRRAKELYDRWADDSERAARRYANLFRSYDYRSVDQETLRENFVRYAGEEAVRYPQAFVKLSLDYYRGLLELALSSSERFYEQMLGGKRSDTIGAESVTRSPVKPRRRVNLELRSQIDGRAAQSFVIENNRDIPAEIIFFASDFVGQKASGLIRPDLSFTPPRLRLGPKEAREVTVEFPVTASLFKPNERYEATVMLGGYEELELGLTLFTEETEAKEADGTL